MKTKSLLFLTLIFVCISAVCQEHYYYYNGEKRFIEVDSSKASVIIPINGSENMPQTLSSLLQAGYAKSDTAGSYRIVYVNLNNNVTESNTALLSEQLYNNSDENIFIYPSYKTSSIDEMYLTNYINVRLKTASDVQLLDSIAGVYGLEIEQTYEYLPLWYTLSITSQTEMSTLETANAIYETGLFQSVSPDFSHDLLESVDDPDFNKQWGLHNSNYSNIDISVVDAWNISTGEGVTIAVVDHGIDMSHPDLNDNIHPLSYDTETFTSPSQLFGYHGTHCAGIAGAEANNLFIRGVAPDAKLMSVSNKLSGPIASMQLAAGINWSWKNGADIISCSWRSTETDVIKEALDSALIYGRNGKGTIIVKSAGNQYMGPVTFPGNYRPEILTVSSISSNGSISDFSSIGNEVDVCAPGDNIYSTMPNGSAGYLRGTSLACPHVSGVAALILGINPSLTGNEVRDIIERNAKKIGNETYNVNSNRPNGTWNLKYGYGLVDAYASVTDAGGEVMLSDKVIETDTLVHGNKVTVKNVTVKEGAKLTIESNEETKLETGVEIEKGAELEIK